MKNCSESLVPIIINKHAIERVKYRKKTLASLKSIPKNILLEKNKNYKLLGSLSIIFKKVNAKSNATKTK